MEKNSSKKIIWLGRVISFLSLLPFLMSAIMKFTNNPQVVQGMAQFGFPNSLIIVLAILEILCVILYAIPVTSIIGAILFTGYIGGAICTHLRVGEHAFLQIILGILIWLGLYLRDSRIRDLIPLRKKVI